MLLTALAMDRLEAGQRVEMVGDDPAIAEDIPAWCQETGNRLVKMGSEGKNIRCLVEKSAGPAP
jgi:TusA-related sulfurtransferase